MSYKANSHIGDKTTCFKKWSRKGYAVFGSLGNVVHIGRLSIALVQWLGEIVLHVNTVLQQAVGAEREEEDKLNELTLEGLATISDDDACSVTLNNDINNRQQGYPCWRFFILIL